MINYYYRDDEGQRNCEEFARIVADFPDIKFFQPSPGKAPWHVQAMLDCGVDVIELNFWPHKIKGNRKPMRAVEGADALRALIDQAIQDMEQPDAEGFDLFEDF